MRQMQKSLDGATKKHGGLVHVVEALVRFISVYSLLWWMGCFRVGASRTLGYGLVPCNAGLDGTILEDAVMPSSMRVVPR